MNRQKCVILFYLGVLNDQIVFQLTNRIPQLIAGANVVCTIILCCLHCISRFVCSVFLGLIFSKRYEGDLRRIVLLHKR